MSDEERAQRRRSPHRIPRRASEEEGETIGPPPQAIGTSLEQLVRHLGWGPKTSAVGVIADWERLVGPTIAANARAVASDGSTLVVAVEDPAWAPQLRWLEAGLLDRLAEETGVRFERLVIRVRTR